MLVCFRPLEEVLLQMADAPDTHYLCLLLSPLRIIFALLCEIDLELTMDATNLFVSLLFYEFLVEV